MIEHKNEKFDGFTKKYYLKKLVYVEPYKYIIEKNNPNQIKKL